MRRLLTLTAVAVLSIALAASVAPVATSAPSKKQVNRVYKNCNAKPRKLARKFSKRTLRTALRRMPKDLKQYTECPTTVRRAIRVKKRR